MKKRSFFYSLVILALSFSQSSFAWGKRGHEIVAEVAFSQLDNNVKDSLKKYLDTTSIEYASVWMDEMRSNPNFNYMKTWHYVDFEKGKNYTDTKEENIVNALNKAIDNLEHRDTLSKNAVKMNLLIIFHLVGDLHMPLHIGYAEDKGGNTIQVKYNNHQSNLHRVWDTEIIESENITTKDCIEKLSQMSSRDRKEFQGINVKDWIIEPRALLGNVYDFKNSNIDEQYIAKNKPVIEQQLTIAGIRLAAVLESAFHS